MNERFDDQCCGDCQFFYQTDEDGGGDCRRFPAQVVTLTKHKEETVMAGREIQKILRPIPHVQAYFPKMRPTDVGCGEYREN